MRLIAATWTILVLSECALGAAAQKLTTVKITNPDTIAAAQETPVWCWAACVQMLARSQGVELEQNKIVSGLFGAPLPVPSGDFRPIALALQGEFTTTQGTVVRFAAPYNYGTPTDIAGMIRSIKDQRPFVFAWRGHAYTAYGIEFTGTERSPSPRRVFLIDPMFGYGAPKFTEFTYGKNRIEEINGTLELQVTKVVAEQRRRPMVKAQSPSGVSEEVVEESRATPPGGAPSMSPALGDFGLKLTEERQATIRITFRVNESEALGTGIGRLQEAKEIAQRDTLRGLTQDSIWNRLGDYFDRPQGKSGVVSVDTDVGAITHIISADSSPEVVASANRRSIPNIAGSKVSFLVDGDLVGVGASRWMYKYSRGEDGDREVFVTGVEVSATVSIRTYEVVPARFSRESEGAEKVPVDQSVDTAAIRQLIAEAAAGVTLASDADLRDAIKKLAQIVTSVQATLDDAPVREKGRK